MPSVVPTRVRDLTPPTDPSKFPQLDEARSIIAGVKLCGLRSRNSNRTYDHSALAAACRIYEGAPLNISHLKPGETQRGYTDRLGWAENVRMMEDGIYGDLRYNPEHREAKSLVWWAKNNPRAIGVSQDAFVRKIPCADGERVTEILALYGLDLVADPATTAGLTEAIQMDETTITPPPEVVEEAPGEPGYQEHIGKLITAIMMDKSLSSADKKKKVLAALKLLDDDVAAPTPPAPEETEETEAFKRLRADVTGMRADLAKVTEALLKPAKPGATSVAREAVDVSQPTPTPAKKEVPKFDDLMKTTFANGRI